MKILVTGSREALSEHRERIEVCLRWTSGERPGPHELIHGAARGADRLAALVATDLGWTITAVPAKWSQLGDAAGMARNLEMIGMGPDVVLAFPLLGAANKGTAGCIQAAWRAGIPTLIFPLRV